MPVGVVDPELEFLDHIGCLRERAAGVELHFEARYLDLEVAQGLRQRIVQLARDHRALFQQCNAAPLVAALGGGESRADVVADRSQQLHLPLFDLHAGRQLQQHHAVGFASFGQRHREHALLAAADDAHAGFGFGAETLIAAFLLAPGLGLFAAGVQGDGKSAPVVFLARADCARLESGDALDVAHHRIERGLRERVLGQRARGVVQDFQRHVGARQLLGLFLHPRLQRRIAARQILHHVIERLPELAQLVLAGMPGAHAEVAHAHATRALEQVAEGHDDLSVHQEQRNEHHHDDREQSRALDQPQRLDAPLQVVFEQVYQPVDIEHIGGHARDERVARRRALGDCARDRGFERAAPVAGDAVVGAAGRVGGIRGHAAG